MKKYLSWSPFLFAIATIAFGLLQIITGNFNKGLLPVPAGLPGRTILAYSSGTILIILGIGLFVNRWKTIASFSLGIVWLIYFVVLHLVLLSTDIFNAGEWTAAFEAVILCSGAFFLTVINAQSGSGSGNFSRAAGKLFTVSRYALALALIVFAVLHFKYAEYISTLIPGWIPARLFLAYFIGVAFILTAVSIVINRLADLSTRLIGFMFLLWVFILHGPRALAAMNSEPEWTSLFVASASSGTCLMLSWLLRGRR